MGLLDNWKRRRDERHEITRLNFQREDLVENHRNKVTQNGWKTGDLAYQASSSEFFNEIQLLDAQIAAIETRRSIALATRWQVPIPARPVDDEDEDDERGKFWDYHTPHGRFYLSDVGTTHIRREVSTEQDIYYKPWYSGGALLISVLSVIVAVLAIIWGS